MGPNSSDLQSVLSQGWSYRGEGNANLVLSLPKSHQILRIRKARMPKTILAWLFDWLIHIFALDDKRLFELEIKHMQFYNYIMVPWFGKVYVQPASNINTGRAEISKLNRALIRCRPAHRKHKHLQYGSATLFKDYAFLPEQWNHVKFSSSTFAVEIKPKQGWIPTEDRCFYRCRFCLNQHLKLQTGKIKAITSYCPLDMFSGDKIRMVKALKSLISGPQNNFKIFKNGNCIYGEGISKSFFYEMLYEIFDAVQDENRLIDMFCDLMIQALLKELNYELKGCVNCDTNNTMLPLEKNTYVTEIGNNSCVFNTTPLPAKCVLDKILSMQKLNYLGVDRYCDIYKVLSKNKSFNDWNYVVKLLQDVKRKNYLSLECIIKEYAKSTKNTLEMNHNRLLNDLDLAPYLLAAVANDCSFMITFRKLQKNEAVPKDVLIEVDDSKFLLNIGVFDLYPKPASTIVKHAKRSLKMQNAYNFSYCSNLLSN